MPPNSEIHPVDRHVDRQTRLLCTQRNLAQGDLGKGVGISYQQMQKYETGKNRVSASMLCEIARFMQVSPALLFDSLPEPGAADVREAADEPERIAVV